MKHNLIELEQRLLDGLPIENQAWGQKFRELDYFECKNEQYICMRADERSEDFDARPKVTSNLTYQVINELGKGLYNPGPYRSIKNGETADQFYQSVVTSNVLNAKMQRMDELSTLHGAAAIQIAPSDTPGKPLKLYPWMATEFFPYFEDDDPSQLFALLIRSVFAYRRQIRFQLWDAESVRTYWTNPGDMEPLPRGTGRKFNYDGEASGEHGLGCLPFVFIHAKTPVTSFWEGGLGETLIRVNHVLDTKLSDMAQAIQLFSCPRQYALNVNPSSSFTNIPGNPIHIVGDSSGSTPSIFFQQPNIDVENGWLDINSLIDRTLTELDIPLQRASNQGAPESGTAQLIRRMSSFNRTTSRQPSFVEYEKELARKILTVAGKLKVDNHSRDYLEAANALEMEVSFPPLALPMPDDAKNLADEFMLKHGLKSSIQILAERRGLTREQAIQTFKDIVADRKLEAELLAGATPGTAKLTPVEVDEGSKVMGLVNILPLA